MLGLAAVIHSAHAQGERPPASVAVEAVSTMDRTEPKSYVGTIKGDSTVDIVARVDGTLWKAAFKEGSIVEKDALLFEIEDTIYKANTAAAEAVLKQVEAELDFARKEHQRYQQLFKADVAAKTTYEGSQRSLQFYEAKVEEARAALALRKNDLSYTKIYAPIGGRIGSNIYSTGNYISPEKGKLARIVKFDPISINFAVSEADFLRHFKDRGIGNSILTIARADGAVFNRKVWVDFFDNEIDSSTGTLRIQLQAENPDMELVPGGYVKVNLAEKFEKPVAAVRVTGIMTDGKGHYVYVVDKDNVVTRRDVVIGRQVHDKQLIDSGLEAGERVIVSGLHKVAPGAKVNPVDYKTDGLPK
jgi:RND family efflux transporter MFP subunit